MFDTTDKVRLIKKIMIKEKTILKKMQEGDDYRDKLIEETEMLEEIRDNLQDYYELMFVLEKNLGKMFRKF